MNGLVDDASIGPFTRSDAIKHKPVLASDALTTGLRQSASHDSTHSWNYHGMS
jgi:hypothetical protein